MAKKVRTPISCMAAGVYLGRLACGVAALERALVDPNPWSAAYAASTAARPMIGVLRALEQSLHVYSPNLRTYAQQLGPLTEHSGSYFPREKVEIVKNNMQKALLEAGQMALEACGKRRPGAGDVAKLLRTRRTPKAAP